MDDFEISFFYTFSDARVIWRSYEENASLLPFQGYDFLYSWYQNIGCNEGVSPVFVSVTNKVEDLLLFFPLGIRKSNYLLKLEWLGTGIIDYGAPIMNKTFEENFDAKYFSSIWNAIKECMPRVDVIALKNQVQMVNDQKNPFISLSRDSHIGITYFAELRDDWSRFKSANPRKKISMDSSRQLKRLHALGKLSFQIAKTKVDIEKFLGELVAQKELQYYETKAENIFSKAGVRNFYTEVSNQLFEKGVVQISALILDDKVLACHWGLIYQKRFYYLMPSYRRDKWAKYSPGRLLMEYLIKWSIENGLHEFDFTIGDEDYKKKWSTQESHLYELVEFRTLIGIPYYLVWLAKLRIRGYKDLYHLSLSLVSFISKLKQIK